MATNRHPFAFFGLVLLASVPVYLLGARSVLPASLPHLPASALMVVVPAAVALALGAGAQGWNSAWRWLAAACDPRRVRGLWWLPAFGLLPPALVLAYHLANLMGPDLPPMTPIWRQPGLLVGGFAGLLLLGLAEEVGWTGYATDPLSGRFGALTAALLIGGVGAIWHLVPYLMLGRGLSWVVWQCVATILQRIIMVWLYNGSGRAVFATVVFHASFNISFLIFPHYGSLYDPAATSLVLAVVVVGILLWGRRHLPRADDDRAGSVRNPASPGAAREVEK